MFQSPSRPPRILLVDDDPDQAEVASYIAYELGCDFDSALTGAEALEKVFATAPDIVLLDVKMPDLSGYEVCRRIKTDPEAAGTQVLFVTARNEEEDLLQGFEAFANDYVTKPFSPRELKARTKNALRTKELLDTLGTRNRILELQQEITDRLGQLVSTDEAEKAGVLVNLLDRVAAVFRAHGATLHLRRPQRPDMQAILSTTWPDGPPAYLAALAISEDPRTERAPRLPGEAGGHDWIVISAPLWIGKELAGTLRLHRRAVLPRPGESTELEHLVDLAAHLSRLLHLSELLEERRTSHEEQDVSTV